MKSHKISPATGQYQDDRFLPALIPVGAALTSGALTSGSLASGAATGGAALMAAHPVSTGIGVAAAGGTIGTVVGNTIYAIGRWVYDSITGEKIYQTSNMGNYGYDQQDPAYNPNQYGNSAINGCYPGYNC